MANGYRAALVLYLGWAAVAWGAAIAIMVLIPKPWVIAFVAALGLMVTASSVLGIRAARKQAATETGKEGHRRTR